MNDRGFLLARGVKRSRGAVLNSGTGEMTGTTELLDFGKTEYTKVCPFIQKRAA